MVSLEREKEPQSPTSKCGHRRARPPGNPLGMWINVYLENKPFGVTKLGEQLDFPGIHKMIVGRAEEISLYSIQMILEGTEMIGVTSEEMNARADAVAETIAMRVESKGDVFDRLPPGVAAVIQKGLDYVTYTDAQLEIEFHVGLKMIKKARKKFGIETVLVGQKCADKIKKYIDENKKHEEPLGTMAALISEISGVSDREFVQEISCKTGISQLAIRNIKKGTNPTPERFGVLLEVYNPNEEQVERLTDLWLPEFRKTVTHDDLGREMNLSRKRVGQIAKEIGIKNEVFSWDDAERLREYRTKWEEDHFIEWSERAAKRRDGRTPMKKEKARIPCERENETSNKRAFSPDGFSEKSAAQELEPNMEKRVKPDYPNVITPEYLYPLTEKEKAAAQMLAGSSRNYPVQITGDLQKAVELLIDYGTHPEGAFIRVVFEVTADGKKRIPTDKYYLEYKY